jgi:hypothetical protein
MTRKLPISASGANRWNDIGNGGPVAKMIVGLVFQRLNASADFFKGNGVCYREAGEAEGVMTSTPESITATLTPFPVPFRRASEISA